MAIRRGVSPYSYQNATFQGAKSLEDCIRTSAELCGVEKATIGACRPTFP